MAVLQQMPASDSQLEEIRSKSCEDETLIELTNVISSGWPVEKKDCSESIKPYWDSRADLTTANGLVLTLCVRRSRKVDNAELPRPTAGKKTRQKNINLFPGAYLENHAS